MEGWGSQVKHPVNLHLGARLRQRRQLAGLTQQQLGQAVGVRFQQIQKYECGANKLSAAMLSEIARALNVSVSFFYEGLGEGDSGQPSELRDLMQRKETIELLRALNGLEERKRRQLIKLVMALNGDREQSGEDKRARVEAP